MDYELLHEVSLIDREIQKIQRTKVDNAAVKELSALKHKHKLLKENYGKELQKQTELAKKIKTTSNLLDEKTRERVEQENNLYSTSNTKTIEMFQKIIEKFNDEIKELEAEIYVFMDENETFSIENKKLVNDVNEIRASYNEILSKYRKNQGELEKKIELLSIKRKSYIDNVSPEARREYEDIKMERGFGMSEVKGEICSGCYVGVPVVIIDEVKYTKKLIKCPNCSRLLYIANQ